MSSRLKEPENTYSEIEKRSIIEAYESNSKISKILRRLSHNRIRKSNLDFMSSQGMDGSIRSHTDRKSTKLIQYSVTNKKNIYEQLLSIEYLVPEIMNTFNQILRRNEYEDAFSKEDIDQRIELKKELRRSLRNCAYGDRKAKIYVKDYIKEILIKKYGINESNINRLIAFDEQQYLTVEDQFDIMLYHRQNEYKNKALEHLIEQYNLDKPKKNQLGDIYYEIDAKMIQNVYQKEQYHLDFIDKLEIVTQRIYERYKGNGVIDTIRDMKIDGISAGVSGIPENFEMEEILENTKYSLSYDSVWIFYKGKSIHLSFLSFGSYKELIRVCKNIYRYNSPGQLSEVTGYIVNEMKDGSRVAVARPPFCESWILFIRKFDTLLQEDIHHLITDRNSNLPILIMKSLIKGCQVIGITGEQGSGKTTLLMSLIGFIHPTYNLRIQELSFELHARKIYPERNIVTFREVNGISGQEGLDFQKKTDGTVNILGEVASNPVANWLVQMSLVASLFTLFTHHAKTTRDLVISLRNALLLEGGFTNEYVATEQVIHAIRFDIHMRKSREGHRYIERITEIMPKSGEDMSNPHVERNTTKDLTNSMFECRDIIAFENNQYVIKNYLSVRTMEELNKNLNEEEQRELYECFLDWGLNRSE
ncbi:pilus assembly protein CpaF [Anaeromicropila herbilytica]|uniref:Pilus assembly protein CpaF n=1 Tax=Anaeromicropila herbilytica TaxID=2785025 RepID=A0A7R7EKR2_9FIRM|nr:pilus assembly protein CpaF [Anaeromicropila herbilytica]BCN30242.1 hypothetical protein bsdtb5_15370 [Anaeromicropila herbilytica]